MTDEVLHGGVNRVVRVAHTVHRPVGDWSETVHRLLNHVTGLGFTGAPRAHGIDPLGHEVLDFVAGDTPDERDDALIRDDANLTAVAAMLRAYHDATADFPMQPADHWYFPPREPAEVICHGDVAPYNTVYRDGRPVAFIDFDTAHPGPRVWDVAYAAYRFVPLSQDGPPVDEQARRLRLFADGYGLSLPDREQLVDVAVERLRHLIAHMRDRAGAGHPAFASHLADGHDRLYETDRAHLRAHRDHLTAALR
ncbi:phosphotransferase family enzyme [Stackebrandtia albiflava]|uniref:Phosphotransferase family enzyme n=1 Tax=Stackebrandtia albiflava TaxID=406432 RepID=A0A562VA01_9ACTN|nr:phosphotransferase [Stackebrandtia albiflava]TWJ14678.1 phosphotransferase family enzyme [Stackebrandtia albiflava]